MGASAVAGLLLCLCVGAGGAFVVRYAAGSVWRSTALGRCLMLFVGTLTVLMGGRAWIYLFGPFPASDWAFAIGYVPLGGSLLWLGLLLRRRQRASRGRGSGRTDPRV